MVRAIVRAGLGVVAGVCVAGTAFATTMIIQDTRALVRGSSDIVVGTVQSVRSRWDARHEHIVTDVEVGISESLKGEQQRITLTQLGGEVDGMRLSIPGCPAFKPGEETLLFVWRDAQGRAQLNGLGQGKFEIRVDPVSRQRVLSRSLPGLEFADVRTLRALRAGEKAPQATLTGMLGVIRGELTRLKSEAGAER